MRPGDRWGWVANFADASAGRTTARTIWSIIGHSFTIGLAHINRDYRGAATGTVLASVKADATEGMRHKVFRDCPVRDRGRTDAFAPKAISRGRDGYYWILAASISGAFNASVTADNARCNIGGKSLPAWQRSAVSQRRLWRSK